MNKYRVLKAYPKQITNSGRLVTLKPGAKVYLKAEAQVVRLVSLGFIKQIVELPKRVKKPAKKPAKVEAKVEVKKSNRKSEYLNKKNKGDKSNSQEQD